MTNLGAVIPTTPLVDARGFVTVPYYQFFNQILQRTGGAAGVEGEKPATVGTGLAATGANQATALPLENDWNEVDSVPAGTGVILTCPVGNRQLVWNVGANALLIYPPNGGNIDAKAPNAAYSLASAATPKCQSFFRLTSTQWRTDQLQIP